jgi:hypothetical protein
LIEVVDDLLFIPNVVSRRQDIHTERKERIGNLRGDTNASRRILDVHHCEVSRESLNELEKVVLEYLSSRASDNIPDH